MKQPTYSPDWTESWKLSYHYDLLEFFGDTSDLGYSYAYQRRFNQTIEAVKRYLSSGDRIIDIAAAQGNFSLHLSELGFAVTWNDLRAELAEYVKLKQDSGKVDFAVGNCLDLDCAEAFDAAIITEVIEHVAHPDEFLRNTAKLVKPGGYIIMTTPNGEYIRNNLPKFSDCSDPSIYESEQFKPNADGHIFLLHREEIKALVEKSGLVLKELRLFTNPLTAGYLGTRHFLRFVPKPIVDRLEALTALHNGQFLPQLNTHTLGVLWKP